MMKVTRNVILDLLPMYLADEVSTDTHALIEEYLKTDPELTKFAEQSKTMRLSPDVPIPLTQDDKMKTYRKAKRLILLHAIILAGLISIGLVITIFIFFFTPP